MYGFKECSSCGALYNREHCCSNVSSVDNFVRDPNPISYDETPDSSQQPPRNCSKCGDPFSGLYCRQCTCERCRRNYTDEVCALCCYEVEKSFVNDSNSNSFIDSPNIFYPPSQPQTSSLDQWHCFHCKDPLERGERCKRCSCKWCGSGLSEGFCFICASNNKNSSIGDPNPNSFNDSQNLSDYPPQPQYQTNSCELCRNDAYYSYDCTPQVSFIYNQDPCFNQNFDNNFPQTSPSFPQQYLCCENCGGPHETFQCQPLNQNFYEPNLCYNSNSSGFDQYQPPQSLIVYLLEKRQWEKFFEIQHAFREKQHQPEDIQELLHKLLKDLQIISEELAEYINSPSWNYPAFYDDDDEYTIQYREYLENSSIAIAPDLPTEEPDNSLSMGDEHLSIISKTELDKLIKSSVENLVPIPSESEDFSDNESECDVPVCDDFTTFSNPLFDSDDDFSSSDDESFFDEDVPKENFKIYLNPLFDEEIISSKIDPHHFNAESDLIESLLNRDIFTFSYLKIDYLLEEFSGKLTHIDLIPPGINEANFDPEEEIRLIEELWYDNSSPRPSEESNSEISDATIESSSPSPIPVEDSDSLMEEIDLFLDPDDSIPQGILSDDYDSEGDILFLEELLSNDSLSLPETESFHFDHYDVPSSPRPPTKPPDDGIFFDFKPDTGVLTAKVVEDISKHYVLMPKLLLTQPTLCPDIDTLLPFSSKNEDKVFNPGIVSSPLLSHRGKIISDFSESPMMITGGNIPLLDVPYLHPP
ncbi:hypothetical protein Tco_1492576 [Tanacetum coccineum]